MECIRPVPLENGNKEFAIRIPLLGSKQMLKVKETLKDGCGKVDRAISSNTRLLGFKSRHQQFFKWANPGLFLFIFVLFPSQFQYKLKKA